MSDWNLEVAWKKCHQEATQKIFICAVLSTLCAFLTVMLPPISIVALPMNIICVLLVPLLHIFYANRHLLSPAYRRLSPARRLFLRWGSRLAFAQLVVYVYTPSVFWVAIMTCPVGFLGFTKVQQKAIAWQLYREENGLPLTMVEKILLGTLVVVSAGLFFLAITLAAAFGLAIEWMLSLQG